MALLVIAASLAVLVVALTHRSASAPAALPAVIDLAAMERDEAVVDAEVVAEWRRPTTPVAARYAGVPRKETVSKRSWVA